MTMIIAAVAVVVVVAAGGVVLLNGDSGSTNGGDENIIASQLQIRGNANDDYTIDASDMAIVEDIIAGNKKIEDYPLADVNADGKVDDADKGLLQDLIDRKAGTKVYVLCLDVNGNNTTVEATYPLRNVVPYGTNLQLPCLYANGGQYVAGYFTSSYSVAEASIASTAVDLKGATRQIPDSAWTNFTKLDADLSKDGGAGVGALLVDYSGIAQITTTRAKDLNDACIPLMIFSSADARAEITTVLTLGFLFGGDCETLGVKYAEESWTVLKTIESKLSGLSDKDKTSYISCTMYYYICQNDSTFNTSGIDAGGIPYYKVNSEFAKAYEGTGSVKMASVEALSNYKDIGCIINNRSMDWGLSQAKIKDTILGTWEHDNSGISSTEYFKGFETKLNYVNNLLPGGAKLAYIAHALYGDKFSAEWADGVLQTYINMDTEPLKGQTLDTIIANIDYTAYQKAKGTVVASESAIDVLNTVIKKFEGTLSTGKDGAKLEFAKGSVEESAKILVSNGNSSGYSPAENTIVVKISNDAKSLYEANKTAYSAKVGTQAMGKTYAAANVVSKLDGVYGYYINISETSASGYLSGYADYVFFECYFYKASEFTDKDFQEVADAMYTAIFDTIKYDGPAIPEDVPEGTLVGAGLVAGILADESEDWTVTSDGCTESVGALVYHYKNTSGAAKEVKITLYIGTDADEKYTEASTRVNALIGQPSMSTKYPYSAYDAGLTGVKCVAISSQMSSSGYAVFAMQYGNIVISVDADDKILFIGEDAKIPFKTFLESVSAFLTRADVVANSLAVTNSALWTVKDGATATDAILVFHYTSSSGAKEATVSVYSGADAADAYATASATVTSQIGQPSMSTKYPYSACDADITGVDCNAINSQMSNSGYAKFAIHYGNVVISTGDDKVYFTGTDVTVLYNAFLVELADAITA